MTEEKKNNSAAEELNAESVQEETTSKSSDETESQVEDNNKIVEEDQAQKEKKHKSKKDSKEEKIKELESKLNEVSDKYLRLQAEFDNFRRRTIREKAELIKSGGESVIKGILPVIDDFERAVNSMKEIPDDDSGKQGTLLIYSKFRDFLKQNNVREIEALHKDFDVDLHEALTKIPVEDKEFKGKIVEVIQNGYTLNDKVIRFAKVVVGE